VAVASDEELLDRYRSQRSAADFAQIVARHGIMVFRTCLRLTGNAHDAEDAAQGVFLLLAQRPDLVRHNLGGWLHTVARSTALNLLMARKRRDQREKKVASMTPVAQLPAQHDWREEFDTALEQLPGRLRQAVVLRYLEDHTQEEAARLAGCPQGTIARRSKEGLERLRSILTRSGAVVTPALLVTFMAGQANGAVPACLLGTAKFVAAGALATGTAPAVLAQVVAKTFFWAKVKAYALGLTGALMVGAVVTTAVMHKADPPAPANPAIVVGSGLVDGSAHQLVRTRGNVLYVFAQTADEGPGAILRVHKAKQPGTPVAFEELDAAHAPDGGVNAAAVAIDGQDVIHALWLNRRGEVNYAPFQIATDTWGTVTKLENTNWTALKFGDEGAALAVDAAGKPHAFWTVKEPGGRLRIHYASKGSSGWSVPATVDDTTAKNSWHPTIAFAPNGELLLAWLDGEGDYSADGIVRVRVRRADGSWAASGTIPDTAMTAADNSPALVITEDGFRHIVFCNTRNEVRYWYSSGGAWQGDRQPALQVTHNPGLGPDGHGGLYLYGHGTPPDNFRAIGAQNLYRFHKPAGATSWGPWQLYASGPLDCAASTRWAQFCHAFPQTVDVAYFSYPPKPEVILYVGTDGDARKATPATKSR
jgi:RNA polymerase sigma factor (sigma-70 family)